MCARDALELWHCSRLAWLMIFFLALFPSRLLRCFLLLYCFVSAAALA